MCLEELFCKFRSVASTTMEENYGVGVGCYGVVDVGFWEGHFDSEIWMDLYFIVLGILIARMGAVIPM